MKKSNNSSKVYVVLTRLSIIILFVYLIVTLNYFLKSQDLVNTYEAKIRETLHQLSILNNSSSLLVKDFINNKTINLIKDDSGLITKFQSSQSEFHVVTYASHGGRDDRFCRAIESALRHDIDLIILGWGVPWKGLSQKLDAAYTFASSIGKHDIMMFTDAFDVMFTERKDVMLQKYLEINAEILFAGECGCWPHIMENGGADCFDRYPLAPTPYRYLNSGSWIARASSAKDMLAEIIRLAGNEFTNANDQKLVADMFMDKKFPIALDYYNVLFQSMHMTIDRTKLAYCNPHQDIKNIQGKFYNRRTNSTPGVFHFNGGGKLHHLEMEGRMWYKREMYNTLPEISKLGAKEITAPLSDGTQRSIRFDSICGDYVRRLKVS